MTIRAKLNIASITASGMMLLNVFAKPLHIPPLIQSVLIFGVFIPLILVFRYIERLKQEQNAKPETVSHSSEQAADPKRQAKRRLLLIMGLGVAVGLTSPLWMPITGTSLGVKGDFAAGMVTAAIVCTIMGIQMRRI